ncbi:M16 family metallopeptidase [Patescibacteria group bacterium]
MFEKHTLSNGLDVITAPLKETKVITILIMFGVGSRFENNRIRGISHFLEHMVFKGTKKRPTSFSITKSIDSLGADYNAFTGKDMTAYYIKVKADHLETAIDLLSDMLLHSKFEAAEVKKEKGVIIEEINMYEDTPMMHVEDLFEEELFGNQPLGRNIAGTRDSIIKMKQQDFVDYVRRFYNTGNAVAVFAGAVDEAKVAKVSEKYLSKFRSSQRAEPKKASLRDTKTSLCLDYKKSEQTHLAIGFPALSYTSRDKTVLDIINVIMGGSMSSRLFSVIREKRGMAYYVRTSFSPYSDTGAFVARAGLDNNRVFEAVKLIVREFERITKQPVGKEELKRAKEYSKGHLAIQLEDSENVANFLARQHMYERSIKTLDAKMAEIDVVTIGDIKRVAKQLFRPNKLNLALIGPFKDKQKFDKLLNFSR